jgi:serine/threonine protein kinase/CRP-like cAMP-binding protein
VGTGTPAGIIDAKVIAAAGGGDGDGDGSGAELFGRYQIIERLAVGGMAEILLARSLNFGGVNRTCVIKRILPQYSRDLTFVSMFIDEARITIGLDHKNIVKLYDFGQHDGVYFMAIEYLDGTDLAALMRLHLQQGRGVFAPLAAFIVREMCNGAHHAHTLKDHNGRPLGIVHRDVSPQNVLLSSTGEVKLTDFGIAAARHKLTLTSPGTVLGKAAYMAPEQATGKPVDFATDVWAAGVILHEMLAGERLFADETPLATIQRVVHDPIQPPSMKLPTVPKELDRIVMKALERNPRARWPSAEHMAHELTAFLKSHPSEGHVFGEADLARALVNLEWSDDTARMRPSRRAIRSAADTENERPPVEGTRDPKLKQLYAELRAQPDLWTLVAIGDRFAELDIEEAAISAYRTASAIFAHRGLLVQALCAYDGAKRFLQDDEVNKDLLTIGDLSTGNRAELIELLKVFDRHELWQLMQEADPEGLGAEAEAQPFPAAPTPLFGYLGPLELSRMGRALRVRRVKPGDVVIREGDAGDALYAVGRGRLVVYCKPGDEGPALATVNEEDEFEAATSVEAMINRLKNSQEPDRVYLAGLADGDFFGEFSFLAERPRSATVEAITDSLLLQIDRAAVDEIVRADPAFTEPLLQFYKERVIELMMAKSPVFSLLEPHDRRGLLDRSDLVDYRDEELVVDEGTLNDHLYFIKRGEVEIFRKDRDGMSIFINKLGAGQFFGEIAALKGTPRTVSVRAMGDVSLFKIDSKALLEIVERQPRLKSLFDATIASRTAEMKNRVREHQRLFFGT